ncbi:MAG: nucleotide pyrophosphohydrolase [Chlamydiales bacterium]|nr:nucleotide pyrophosphohydrolase [Chlamydiales bacterium]
MTQYPAKLKELQKQIREFVSERGWNQYHSPKNISISLNLECSEVLECFQWLTDKDSFEIIHNEKMHQEFQDELADVFFCVLRLADLLEIDLIEAFTEKMRKNREKYPIDKAHGRTEKYDKLSNVT